MGFDLAIVIVNWNSGTRLRSHLLSLAECNPLEGLEIRVVDNASTDGSAAALGDLPWVRVVPMGTNAGFAAAANAGAADTKAPLLLFLNPDILHTPGCLAAMKKGLASHPGAAGGAGLLLGEDGRGQEDFQLRHLPKPVLALQELFLPSSLRGRLPGYRRHFYLEEDRSRPFRVEQPAAACLLLRREVFEAVGGFDESFVPAWWEDVDLAARLKAAGAELWFWPGARFLHQGGYSAGHLGRRAFLPIFWKNSALYYRKHHPLFGRVYQALLPVGALFRWICSLPAPEERRAWGWVLLASLGMERRS